MSCSIKQALRSILNATAACAAVGLVPGLLNINVAAQPANDSCSLGTLPALTGNGGSIQGDTQFATLDGPSCSGETIAQIVDSWFDGPNGGDVWVTFTPGRTAFYRIALSRTVQIWEPVLSIHSACPSSIADESTVIDCARKFVDDFGILQPADIDQVSLTAGITYYIRVGTYVPGEFGKFNLDVINVSEQGACCSGNNCRFGFSDSLNCAPQHFNPGVTCVPQPCNQTERPANDACTGSITLSEGVPFYGNARRMTRTYVEATAPCGSSLNDVLFNFTPSASTFFYFSTCNSFMPVVLSLHTACAPGDSNLIACSDYDQLGTCEAYAHSGTSIAPILLNAGTTYTLRVSTLLGVALAAADYSLIVDRIDHVNVLMGACCLEDNSCVMVIDGSNTCDNLGSFFGATHYAGPNTTCAPAFCNQFLGACCEESGACSLRTQSYCDNVGGTTGGVYLFLGVGTTCQPGVCATRLGACCILEQSGDVSCLLAFANNCGGAYLGDQSVCSPEGCAAVFGACCLTDGRCVLDQGQNCTAPNGVYRGDGTTCTPTTCQPFTLGACCRGASCSPNTPSFDCQGPNTLFVSNSFGPLCQWFDDNGNAFPQCCPADFNHVSGTSVQDIFDFLAAWFAGSNLTDINASGNVTVQDIFDFLAQWFAGC